MKKDSTLEFVALTLMTSAAAAVGVGGEEVDANGGGSTLKLVVLGRTGDVDNVVPYLVGLRRLLTVSIARPDVMEALDGRRAVEDCIILSVRGTERQLFPKAAN